MFLSRPFSTPIVIMGVLVNSALATLVGLLASLIASFVLPQFALPIAILFGAAGFFVAGLLVPEPVKSVGGRRGAATAPTTELEEATAAKALKKQKKAAAEKAKREAAEVAKIEEAAAKAAAKKLAAKKAKKAKAAVVVVESESESESEAEVVVVEEEEEVSAAPKSKSAIKKAKAKAKEAAAKAAEAAAAKAAAAAEKKQKKKGGAAKEAAPVAAAAAPVEAAVPAAATKAALSKAAAKALAAAVAADLEGWETIEATKPTKSQLAAKAAEVVSPVASTKGKKQESIPSSERLLTEDVIIPIKNHALIVGTKGATLNLLTSGSGATIDMPKRESNSAKIQITGTPAQVALARNAIESLVERGFSNITHPGTLSDDINVDPKDMGLIMGPKGETLKTIQSKTGARIDLPDRGSSSKKVTIVGEKDAVRAAKAALRSLITDGFTVLVQPDWIKQEVQFPAEKFGILIGPGGQNIKSIQGNTRARINLPEKNSKSSVVTVCGTVESVAAAVRAIDKILEPLAPLPEPNDESLATDDAWGQEHTAQGEDALWE